MLAGPFGFDLVTREDAPLEEAVDAAMEAAFAEDADAAAADAAAADDPDAADDPGDAPARKSVAFADAPGEDEDAATVAAYYAAKGRELLYKGRDPPKEKRRSSSRAKRDGDGEATDRGEKRERRRSSRKEKKKRASLSEKTDDDVDGDVEHPRAVEVAHDDDEDDDEEEEETSLVATTERIDRCSGVSSRASLLTRERDCCTKEFKTTTRERGLKTPKKMHTTFFSPKGGRGVCETCSVSV